MATTSYSRLPTPEMQAQIEAMAQNFSKRTPVSMKNPSRKKEIPKHQSDDVPRISPSALKSGVIHQGDLYILEKSKKFKNYRFVLRCPYLYYFKRSHFQGGIDLNLYSRNVSESPLRQFSICLSEKSAKFEVVLAATSASDCE